MIKVSLFHGSEEFGPAAVPLFGPADSFFEKVASAELLPAVSNYIATLKPRNDSQYVLVNAMGAGEYYSSNINGDRFSEAALTHAPDDWKGVPAVDAARSRNWAYGYPTFYRAHVFPHHRNKDSTRALGFVELAAWNPHMKRVELVTRLDREPCLKYGGEGIWDKLKAGAYPDVSMGTKVPFDTCSITLDRKLYQEAWDTYEPGKHKHPGEAILEFHKKLKAKNGKGIPGVSITRADYSDYARTQMNHILPDGRKVWVDNDFPAFFDISYVFIGADKIAKAMLKIADAGRRVYGMMGSAELAEKLGAGESSELEKSAEAKEPGARFLTEDEVRTRGRRELQKRAMEKEVIPNQFAGKAVPLLTSREKDLPSDVLQALASAGLGRALATLTSLGMVLRPREFQRVVLVQRGKGGLADELESLNQLFPKTDEREDIELSDGDFSPGLAQLLAPFMEGRSAFGPHIEHRVVVIAGTPADSPRKTSSHSSDLLRKIGAAYNGYRDSLMQFVPHAQDLIEAGTSQKDVALRKVASVAAEALFTPLAFQYLSGAFMDEVPAGYSEPAVVKLSGDQANAGVQRGLPLVTTQMKHHNRTGVTS